MDRRLVVPVAVGALAVVLLAFSVGALDPLLTTGGYNPPVETETDTTGTPTPSEYDHTTVTVIDSETGMELGSVQAAIADTYQKKYTGLSKTESLPESRGMLFPYEKAGNHTYVMRGMDFGIDIIYIDANGTITRIHHASEPPEGEDGNQYRYPGRGQYVLEVTYEWTGRHNVTEGDTVKIDGYNA